jgi:hypothetical protein
MRSHRLRKEHKQHEGQRRTVAFWDSEGERHRLLLTIVNAGPTNLWCVTGDDTDIFIPYNRISAVLDKETARA